MSQNQFHPYELEIKPSNKAGTFQWTIRKNGKLLQRSDKVHRSEDDARKQGEKEIEAQMAGGFSR